MHKPIVTILSLLLILLTGCTDRVSEKEKARIYTERGYNEMKPKKRRLKPEIIKYGKPFYELVEVSISNAIATIDGSGSFALMQFDEKGKIKVEPIVPGFPGVPGIMRSDSEHNVLWIERGRGVYFLDIETKKTGHVVVNNNGNSKIIQSMLLDPEKKLFMISTAEPGSGTRFFTYDLINDKLEEPGFALATAFDFYDKMLLINHSKVGWLASDHNFKQIENSKYNKLTKELTKFQIDIWHKTKTMHLKKRMMLGASFIDYNLIYYSVRWNEEMDEIKIEPLIIQLPPRSTVHTDFVFSADGNWVKTLYNLDDSEPRLTELIIYHAASVYPQGLSMPIYCGYTKEGNEGAFMQHSEWGPVFVERDQDMRDKLFIYKLNEGLEILKEQALNILPSGDKE